MSVKDEVKVDPMSPLVPGGQGAPRDAAGRVWSRLFMMVEVIGFPREMAAREEEEAQRGGMGGREASVAAGGGTLPRKCCGGGERGLQNDKRGRSFQSGQGRCIPSKNQGSLVGEAWDHGPGRAGRGAAILSGPHEGGIEEGW